MHEILDAVTQLGYEGEPDDVDVDGIMVKNVGGGDCFDGDDRVLFSVRSTSGGNFDGGEIIVLTPWAPPEFLQHGRQAWDTAHDLLARLADLNGGVDPEGFADVDALEAIASSYSVGVGPSPVPLRVRMLGAWPNPFNPTTSIRFELAAGGRATLVIFDARGRRIARLIDEPLEAGEHLVSWQGRGDDGAPVPSGVYHAQLRALGETSTVKLVLSK